LAATVAGSTVSLGWVPPVGASILHYLVEAGSAPGAADLARVATADATPALIAHGVPIGTYYVRVRALTPTGYTAASSDVSLVVGNATACAGAPLVPSDLRATVSGGTVRLTWSAPASGCSPTHYVVEAGSGSGASNLAQITVGGASLDAQAPPGTYYVRVRAAHGASSSASSNEVIVTVP
jgi:hypothetical protein